MGFIPSSGDRLNPCAVKIFNDFKKLEMYYCWASSRLDRLWRFDWWTTENNQHLHIKYSEGRDFAGYPCKTWIHPNTYYGTWISAPREVTQKGKQVIFRCKSNNMIIYINNYNQGTT